MVLHPPFFCPCLQILPISAYFPPKIPILAIKSSMVHHLPFFCPHFYWFRLFSAYVLLIFRRSCLAGFIIYFKIKNKRFLENKNIAYNQESILTTQLGIPTGLLSHLETKFCKSWWNQKLIYILPELNTANCARKYKLSLTTHTRRFRRFILIAQEKKCSNLLLQNFISV